MPVSQAVVETRRRTHGSVRIARSALSALSARVEQINADGRWSDEGRSLELASALGQGGAAIRGTLEDARWALESERRAADERLSRIREVAPEALAEARQALAPFLQRAFEDPDVVLRLYSAHLLEPAARRALEEHAGYLADALGPAEGAEFGARWRALQEEVRPRLPAEEQQALEDIEELEAMRDGYAAAGEALAEIELAALANGGVPPEGGVVERANLVARINTYENAHELPSSDPAAAGQQAIEEEETRRTKERRSRRPANAASRRWGRRVLASKGSGRRPRRSGGGPI